MQNKNVNTLIKIFSSSALLIIMSITGCTQPTPQHFTREEIVRVRRLPLMSRVDDGAEDSRGVVNASLNYAATVKEPDVISFKDSSYVSDEFSTLTTLTRSESYMSLHLLSLSLSLGLVKYVSTGIAFDASLGEIKGGNFDKDSKINDYVIEVAWFVRISNSIGKFSFAFKPELFLYTLNGTMEVIADSTLLTGASIHTISLSVRNSLAARFQINENIGVYLGLHHKLQPYSVILSKTAMENAFGIYSGFGFSFLDRFCLSPYVTIPFKTLHTGYLEPVQIGANFTFRNKVKK